MKRTKQERSCLPLITIPDREPAGGSIATKMYQAMANAYRSRACNQDPTKGPVSRPLEDGEIHVACANYEGPGTRIDKYPDAAPINATDACARQHDLDYNASKTMADIHAADRVFLQCIADTPASIYKTVGRAGIEGKQPLDVLPLLGPLLLRKYTAKPEGGASRAARTGRRRYRRRYNLTTQP